MLFFVSGLCVMHLLTSGSNQIPYITKDMEVNGSSGLVPRPACGLLLADLHALLHQRCSLK
jgi:hypothetical protein